MDKVYIVTYDARNEYEYPEDDYGFSDTFGIFSNATIAHKKVYEFLDDLKALVGSKGLVYNIREVYEEGHSMRIEFGMSGARYDDISGFIFYIREAELDHAVATKVEEFNCLNWLREKEEK